jgi:hypothetical protein
MSDTDPIERLKKDALSSYGENRIDAIDTVAAYGEDAIPALIDIAEESSSNDHQQHARKKIREIKGAE